MKFVVRNQAKISNRYIRFAKWKIRKLNEKFTGLIYSEIYIVKISEMPPVYKTTIKLGVPGPDIIVSAQSDNLNEMWADLSAKIKRQLRKYASKKS
jgi:ribosome-associated translation inhibitor RaiA